MQVTRFYVREPHSLDMFDGPFRTRKLGHIVLGLMIRNNADNARTMNVYHCKCCGKYHIGHRPIEFQGL